MDNDCGFKCMSGWLRITVMSCDHRNNNSVIHMEV